MRIDTIHKLLKVAYNKADQYNIVAFEITDVDNVTKYYNLDRNDMRKATLEFMDNKLGENTIRFRNKEGESLGIFNINYAEGVEDPFEIVYDYSNNEMCKDIFDQFEADHLEAQERVRKCLLDISLELDLDYGYVKRFVKKIL